MSVINPSKTVTIAPQRPTEDFGEETFTPLPSLEAVISLQTPYRALTASGSRVRQGGIVFVPRGSDLRTADKFLYKGHEFRVVGLPRADQDHPITGDDFGWIEFLFEGAF